MRTAPLLREPRSCYVVVRMIKHAVRLPAGCAVRVDRLLADSIPGFSRSQVQRLLAEGAVRIDGRGVRKGELLHGERTLEVEIRSAPASDLPADEEPEIPVLFVDERCVAFDKPAGTPGHALRGGERGTVANFIAARFPECVAAGAKPLEAGLVHRLDTGTSGVLLAARDREAWKRLRGQFRSGSVRKRYFAVAAGELTDAGEIRRAIEPHPKSRKKVRVLDEGEHSARARPAITRYRPRSTSPTATLLDVEIPTGVMHQIRAHLAAIGHPLLGDLLYGDHPIAEGRFLLHASRLAFEHPHTGAPVEVHSPLPVEFAAALRRLGLEAPADHCGP